MKETLILIGGVASILWAFFHLSFWKIFDWKNSLNLLSTQQRSIMYALTIMMAYALLVFAYISIAERARLASSSLSATLLALIGSFWVLRALLQALFSYREKEAARRSTVINIGCAMMALLYPVPLFAVGE